MASNGVDGATGALFFPEEDALQSGADLEEISRQAVALGTRLIGTTAQMNAYAHARAKLRWGNTTNGLDYEHDGSGWKPIPVLVRASSVQNQTTLLTVTQATVASLALAACPTGIPCLLEVNVVAENGGSGSQRYIDLQAFNGATGVDVLQRFSLPHQVTAGHRFSQTFVLKVTPSDPAFTLKASADQALSVYMRYASLRLTVAP